MRLIIYIQTALGQFGAPFSYKKSPYSKGAYGLFYFFEKSKECLFF